MFQHNFIGYVVALASLLTFQSCNGQNNSPSPKNNQTIGGFCDGCELLYVGMPTQINPVDTSAGWHEKGQKLLVTGTIYQLDGKTPAANVILYYWQTDNDGYYSPRPNLDKRAKRHGHIRGWVKTDAKGKYSIYTVRPAPYPNDTMPAHIHLAVKEPNISKEYYIDELVFDDDPLLTGKKRRLLENRGGSGVVRILLNNQLQVAVHNIVLGLHIPNYPKQLKTASNSGLAIGEDSPSFTPFHAWGPDKGTTTCPVCKYGRYQGLLYFVGDAPNWDDIRKWLVFLEQESQQRSKYLKVYFIYGNSKNYRKADRQKELEQLGTSLRLQHLALTFVPSLSDKKSEVALNNINPSAKNTFILYQHRNIVAKFIGLEANAMNFKLITSALNQHKSEYDQLPEPIYH